MKHFKQTLRYTAASVAAAALAMMTAAPAGAIGITPPTWKPREWVGSGFTPAAHDGANRYLAYDHHGNPGIAAIGGGAGLLISRRLPGSGWSVGHTGYLGDSSPTLVYDPHELPIISKELSGGLFVNHPSSSSLWTSATVELTSSNVGNASMALDIDGKVGLAYSKSGSLFFIEDTDGDLDFADEGTIYLASDDLQSLAYDPLNRPMIAHQEWDGAIAGSLFFTVRDSAFWASKQVDGDPGILDIPAMPSLAINPKTGLPAIAYTAGTSGQGWELRYAEWNDTSNDWDITMVDPATTHNASLAFDPADGNPAIAYYDADSTALRFAWYNGSSWQHQTLDNDGDVGLYPSLAFNDFGDGFPSVAYFDSSGALYFQHDPPTTAPEPGTLGMILVGGLAAVGLLRRRRTSTGPSHQAV